jgi:hypothetical protein
VDPSGAADRSKCNGLIAGNLRLQYHQSVIHCGIVIWMLDEFQPVFRMADSVRRRSPIRIQKRAAPDRFIHLNTAYSLQIKPGIKRAQVSVLLGGPISLGASLCVLPLDWALL